MISSAAFLCVFEKKIGIFLHLVVLICIIVVDLFLFIERERALRGGWLLVGCLEHLRIETACAFPIE